MSNFSRNPFPKKVVWKQDDVTHNRFYWLKVDQPKPYALVIANIKDQLVTISESTTSKITIRLNDNMLNMDEKVKVIFMDKEIFNDYVPRKEDVMLCSIDEYGDPESIYFGEISVSLQY